MTLPLKDRFDLPDGVIYLDGNSLGPLPKTVAQRVSRTLNAEWGTNLITGWNADGWMAQPARLGDTIGRLIGAPAGSVVLGDTLSLKVFQAVSAALDMRPDRKVILSDTGNFPTDLYMTEGLIRLIDRGHQIRLVDPDQVTTAIAPDIAVVLLTQVDYRTGRMHDMDAITKLAHDAGAVMVWDLAHSAGAIPVDLNASGAEFAVGCTYKYLNGGPGAPAYIYVRPDLSEQITPALAGWLGHAAPFAFDLNYRPGPGIERLRVGTPPVIQMAALEAALSVWDDIKMEDIRTRSIHLSELFIQEVEASCPMLELASPCDPQSRGSQVSFRYDQGYAVMQALIAAGVIGDFRVPDIMRFGITPLYIDEQDIRRAVSILAKILMARSWDRPKFLRKRRVT